MTGSKLHNVYLGLGSNRDTPTKQIHQAIGHINRLADTTVIKSAPWFESKAWGVTNQANFINTVILIKTQLTPLALLKAIKTIEYRLMQRTHNKKWHERNIDIDILVYAQRSLNRPNLIIPHPFIQQRCFVVEPLMQLKPRLPHHLKSSILKHQNQHKCHEELTPMSRKHLRRI